MTYTTWWISETLSPVKEAGQKAHVCESIYMKIKNKKKQPTMEKTEEELEGT